MGAVILFPAIDLKGGRAVRLEQGDMARATVFNDDPAAQARAFVAQGFEYLHIVDLDGAFAGRPINAFAIDRILETVALPVQLGGGIRDMATIDAWLEKGVNRVIIGTAAVRDPEIRSLASRTVDIKLTEAIFVFPGWLLLTVLAFSLVVTTLAAVYPARRAARIDPVAALRHE